MKTEPAMPVETRCPACDAAPRNVCRYPPAEPVICEARVEAANREAIPSALTPGERVSWLRMESDERGWLTVIAELREEAERAPKAFLLSWTAEGPSGYCLEKPAAIILANDAAEAKAVADDYLSDPARCEPHWPAPRVSWRELPVLRVAKPKPGR